MSGEQLVIEVPDPQARRYWECTGPKTWQPVVVKTRYATAADTRLPAPLFPEVRTGTAAPRNVLVERADGTKDVRPVRLLRLRCPR